LIREENQLTMMVEDNGKGFEKEKLETGTGNGWYNILSRLRLINGDVELDTQPGKGTVITIGLQLN
jgi:signal transduction histidine kinase